MNAEVFTSELLTKAKELAQNAEWKIKPLEIDGEFYYAAIWHPEAYDRFRKMMAKNNWYRKYHLKRWLKRKQDGITFIRT